ncbi:MAG: hypothetical protein A2Z20_04260 [Bdellovibrionales bacterium RBG_16_40_8]|nr:MAG: hypothetical protein A2Z20_04260 [Bdellovibrionales bacterium RBG_16_40_8]
MIFCAKTTAVESAACAFKFANTIRNGKTNVMKFAVLASGAGSTLDFLLEAQSNSQLHPKICLLITDNPSAGALKVASNYDLPKKCLSPREYTDILSWEEDLVSILLKYNPDFILLAGYVRKIGPHMLRFFTIV